MTKTPNHLCHVGALGWDHDDWVGSFYPSDLPPEWRLSYYNHFFTCCYLDYPAWSGQTQTTLAQWVEDTLPRFRFVLERPGGALSGADAARLALLAPRVGLAATEADLAAQVLWLPAAPDLRRLSGQLQARAAAGAPCYLVSREHDLASLRQAGTLVEILGY